MPSTYALWKREIVRFVRQPSRWIGALATPLLFWVLIGGGMQHSFANPTGGQSYFEFFFPGAISLSVLFTAIFSTISVIEDRHQGFLQGVLVSPVPRSAVVLSKVLGGATLGILQGLLLLLLSPLIGLHLGLAQLCMIVALLFLMASALTVLGFFFAWKIDSMQGYHSIMNIVLFPMWLLSGAVFPLSGSNVVFQWIARVNPLAYGLFALRSFFEGHLDWKFWVAPLLVLGLFSLVFFALSLVSVGTPERSAS
jgi:ABC-2 type transport system permease protein